VPFSLLFFITCVCQFMKCGLICPLMWLHLFMLYYIYVVFIMKACNFMFVYMYSWYYVKNLDASCFISFTTCWEYDVGWSISIRTFFSHMVQCTCFWLCTLSMRCILFDAKSTFPFPLFGFGIWLFKVIILVGPLYVWIWDCIVLRKS